MRDEGGVRARERELAGQREGWGRKEGVGGGWTTGIPIHGTEAKTHSINPTYSAERVAAWLYHSTKAN